VHVGQIEHVVHDLRIFERFRFDPVDDGKIDVFLRRQKQRDQDSARGREEGPTGV
jgi:hypothetical protein